MSDTIKQLLALEMAEQASWPLEPRTAFQEFTGDPRGESTGGAPAGVSGGEGGGAAGAGGGEGGAGGEGGEGGGAGVPDFMEAFESFREDITGRFDGLESRIPEPVVEEPAPPPQTDYFDPRNFSDEDFDEHGQLTREAQQRALNDMIQQGVAEALSPIQEQRQQERRDAAANALEERYPDLTNPEVFDPTLERAQAMAQHMARSTGDRSWAEAWREPAFFEMAYLADVARRTAAGETPAGRQGGVTLESGGSAGPGGAASDDGGKAVANSIVALAKQSKFRLGNK